MEKNQDLDLLELQELALKHKKLQTTEDIGRKTDDC